LKLRGMCEKSWLVGHRPDDEEESANGNEEFDTTFWPRTDKLTGEIVFRGPLGSRIFKNVSESEETVVDRNGDWILESLVSPWRDAATATLAKVGKKHLESNRVSFSIAFFSQIPATKLPLGRFGWSLQTDICEEPGGGDGGDEEGGGGDSALTTLTLTACKGNEFTCQDGM